MNMRLLGLTLGLCACMARAGDDVRTVDAPLGAYGEVPRWMLLGYLPREGGITNDRLAQVGGETNLIGPTRYAGQWINVPIGGEINKPECRRWISWCETVEPGERVMDGQARRAWLFVDTNGVPLKNQTAFLTSELISPDDKNAQMLIRVGGAEGKVLLNGAMVYPPGGQRSKVWWLPEEVALPLRKGVNALVVRIDNGADAAWLDLRLLDTHGMPLRDVTARFRAHRSQTPARAPLQRVKPWSEIVAEIPPLLPSDKAGQFGARLTRTMALLESAAGTRRPVRILFYGQSITAQEWTSLLVNRLRERYPAAEIVAINRALGGWGVSLLEKTIQYDVLRERPDLVCFHAYQGSLRQWERVLSNIRRETTAEIMIRSAHVSRHQGDDPANVENGETMTMSALAQEFGCELVECRQEWIKYLNAQQWTPSNVVGDVVHLNRQGNVLMAQLYERHFRDNFSANSAWYNTVQRYDPLRPYINGQQDEIVLSGQGWAPHGNYMEHIVAQQSSSPKDRLTLKFTGNRVDLALAPGTGGARVLIDGKKPSRLRVFKGTRPTAKSNKWPPAMLLQYHLDQAKAEDEAWELTLTEKLSPDFLKFKFRLHGSKTGFDGEGDNETDFVSKSGKIRFTKYDWRCDKSEADPAGGNLKLIWWVTPIGVDEVRCQPASGYVLWNDMPKQWVTVMDGLPAGEHTLTLAPLGDGPFVIESIEVHRPPLAGP